jgi:hypothetical protein
MALTGLQGTSEASEQSVRGKINWSILSEPQKPLEEYGFSKSNLPLKQNGRVPASQQLTSIPAPAKRSNLNIYSMCTTRIGNTVNLEQRTSFEDCIARPDNPRKLVISNENIPFDFQFVIR